MPRIGVLFIGSPSPTDPTASGFVQGLRDLGYVDGRNVALEFRYAGGRPERLPGLAAELVQAKVDVILTGGPGPLAAARKATDTIPIVTVAGSDPVAEGWAKSLARPGGNVTGLTVTFPGLDAKRLELLKEAMPRIARVALLLAPNELRPAGVTELLEVPARSLGVQVQVLEVREPADFERAFRAAREGHAQAVLKVETTFVVENRARIAELAAQERLPVVGEFTAFGVEGMLMAYGPDLNDLLRRAATHIDRILKGGRPGDIPIERPTKLELVLNLKVARALGITFPQALLVRADRVIE